MMANSKFNFSIVLRSLIILVTGFIIGWLIKPGSSDHQHETGQTSMQEEAFTTWTCSMHPQIRQGEPGKCPICGMDLIPLEDQTDENPREIRMTATAIALANIQTQAIDFGNPVREIRMNGKVQPDERLIYTQVGHIGGRVEQLSINFTGEVVEKGQTIAQIYSPELVTAQEELFVAEKIKATQPGLFTAAKEKLKNWKLTENQIEQILQSGMPTGTFPIKADVSGIVMEKNVNLGDYISRGTPLYEIVDLSRVWVLFDVYESDISFVRVGNQVNFSVSSLPGEAFRGRINFIDPIIDPMTRVAKARVEISNPYGKLKPEMFASGQIMIPSGGRKSEQLLVPKTAVMWTGPRSVVYEKTEDERGIAFEMREVELGAQVGDHYIVKGGLEPGAEIAVHGTFSIDAAAQLAGKPSMMNPQGGTRRQSQAHDHSSAPPEITPAAIKIDEKARHALSEIFRDYFSLKDALVADNFETSVRYAKMIKDHLSEMDMQLFEGEAHTQLMKYIGQIHPFLDQMIQAKDITQSRNAFKDLSSRFVVMAGVFGPLDDVLYVQHCPMADNNQGADWLSREQQIQNPYFGSQMLKCGSVTDTIK